MFLISHTAGRNRSGMGQKNRRNHTQISIISPIQNIVGQPNRQPFFSSITKVSKLRYIARLFIKNKRD